MSGWELVHVADRRGRACARCGLALALPGQSFPRGTFVAMLGDDRFATWRTTRPPNCSRTDRRAA